MSSEDSEVRTSQFEAVQYRENLGGIAVQEPYLSFRGNTADVLKTAYDKLGEPDAVRCYLNGLSLGIEPVDPDHPHAYPLFEVGNGSRRLAVGWIKYELELDEELRGRAKLQYDDDAELWVVDLDEVLGQPRAEAEVSVDNVLSAMRLAGDWLERNDLHEPASYVGRAYNQVKERRDRLRKKERQVADL